MSVRSQPEASPRPAEYVGEGMNPQQWREYLRRPYTAEEIAAREAAAARLEAVLRDLGDAALTEEDVAAYLAELDAASATR